MLARSQAGQRRLYFISPFTRDPNDITEAER
jgi:hypothetical protein